MIQPVIAVVLLAMAPMFSIKLEPSHKKCLLELAGKAIAHGFRFQEPLPVRLEALEIVLHQPAATFVTLYNEAQLAGCIGSLSACQSLAENVVNNAFSAAFNDRRFAVIPEAQLAELGIEIAVLSELRPMEVYSEAEVMQRLRPGSDGLVLEYGAKRATFLPKVWNLLPHQDAFLARLKEKAGLPAEFWSEDFRFSSYTVESFSNFSIE